MAEDNAFVTSFGTRGELTAIRVDHVSALSYVPNRGVQVYLRSSSTAILVTDDKAARQLVEDLGFTFPAATESELESEAVEAIAKAAPAAGRSRK